MTDSTIVPTPSATVVLVRDGDAGLEVFMVERHHEIDFAKGALVFPGGKADDADTDVADARITPGPANLDAAGRAVCVAAIRETFEECGVLLAREGDDPDLVGGERFHDLESRYRQPLHQGEIAMAEMVERENLTLAFDLLLRFSHWITPEPSPRRYDTHFFLVEFPGRQTADHDGVESVDSLWISPRAALEQAEAGERTVVFPTRRNLYKLGLSDTVEAALERARTEPIVTVCPTVAPNEAGDLMLRIPEEAGYDVVEVSLQEALNGRQL